MTPYSYPQALYLGKDASRENVLQLNEDEELDDFRYVLFATHAVLPDELSYINQPAVLLSYPENGGYLTMADAFGLQMNADLVVLSACNTGRGENIKGEGVRGLARAFMYAGTPAVSVSLWTVNSQATQQLNQSFFTQLKKKRHLAEALRQAKIAMIEGEVEDIYSHPYFWAGFVVFGDK
ncbi:MAG: CHAT domain-containing protein [Pseudomonadota bacterium]